MYLEKLRTEIYEYKHREALYIAKKKELMEIEFAYRLLQTKNTTEFKADKKKSDKTDTIVYNLND